MIVETGEELLPPGIDRCGVLLITGIEVFDVGRIRAVKEGGIQKSLVRLLA
jgi:hypothetical protein